MSGQNLYYDFAAILGAAGVTVRTISQNQGWERRARSSGGFPVAPLGVWWHHTASKTSVEGDLQWQCHSCPDGPVGNMLIARDGVVYPVAGGASNCAGKGGPWTFSRGSVAKDSGNTGGFQLEVANNGTGEPWPQAQIDTFFRVSNTLNAHVGNQPTDLVTHRRWAPDRKIDPAQAAVVQGPWVPRSETSSGTWNLDDIKAEALARAGSAPAPGPDPGPGPTPPQPGGDDDMVDGIYQGNGPAQYLCWTSGRKIWITDDGMWDGAIRMCRLFGRQAETHDMSGDLGYFASLGVVEGPRPPGTDQWGCYGPEFVPS